MARTLQKEPVTNSYKCVSLQGLYSSTRNKSIDKESVSNLFKTNGTKRCQLNADLLKQTSSLDLLAIYLHRNRTLGIQRMFTRSTAISYVGMFQTLLLPRVQVT